jgi:hypothetical protein
MTYGKFRTIHLGDITKNKEFELMCPTNRIGTVDVLLGLHHGQASSNSEVMVHALHPRVAIMNDGTRKGGEPDVMKTVHSSPGLEDLWQLHFSQLSGQEYTVPGILIANTPPSRISYSINFQSQFAGPFVSHFDPSQYGPVFGPLLAIALPEFSRQVRDGRDLKASYLNTLSLVTAVHWPAMIMLALLAEPVVVSVMGHQWMDVVPLVRIYCPALTLAVPIGLQYAVLSAAGGIHLLPRLLATQTDNLCWHDRSPQGCADA